MEGPWGHPHTLFRETEIQQEPSWPVKDLTVDAGVFRKPLGEIENRQKVILIDNFGKAPARFPSAPLPPRAPVVQSPQSAREYGGDATQQVEFASSQPVDPSFEIFEDRPDLETLASPKAEGGATAVSPTTVIESPFTEELGWSPNPQSPHLDEAEQEPLDYAALTYFDQLPAAFVDKLKQKLQSMEQHQEAQSRAIRRLCQENLQLRERQRQSEPAPSCERQMHGNSSLTFVTSASSFGSEQGGASFISAAFSLSSLEDNAKGAPVLAPSSPEPFLAPPTPEPVSLGELLSVLLPSSPDLSFAVTSSLQEHPVPRPPPPSPAPAVELGPRRDAGRGNRPQPTVDSPTAQEAEAAQPPLCLPGAMERRPRSASRIAAAPMPEKMSSREGFECDQPDPAAILRKLRAHRESTERHHANLQHLLGQASAFSCDMQVAQQELQETKAHCNGLLRKLEESIP